MSYIGREPQIGNFQMCDAISVVNGQAAYSMQVGGVAVIPGGNFNVIASVNGVIQKAGTSFTINSSTITFSENLVTGDVINFILILGSVLDLGVPSDGTVTSAKITYPLTTFSSTGIDDNADALAITIDSSENVGIGTSSPSAKLHVVGDYGSTLLSGESPKITVQHSGGTNQFVEIQQSGGASFIGTQNGSNDGGLYIIGRHTANNQAKFSPNTVQLYAANTERLLINSSGATVTGTLTTSDQLHINSTASGNTLHTLLKLESDGTADGSGITIDTRTAHTRGEINFLDGTGSYDSNYVFKTATGSQLAAPTEKFRVTPTGATVTGNLTNSGDIFLGTTSATNSAKMTSLFSRISHIGFVSENNGGNDDTEHFRFKNGNGTIGNITAGNTATSYNTSSDYRLKENVDYTWDATTRLKQLKPARFNFIANADLTVDGFIAHEVSSVVPEAIYGDKDGLEKNIDGTNTLDDDGNTIPKYQGIDQSKLVPLLVKTIQELEARITELENA